jgi:hypothetical protein
MIKAREIRGLLALTTEVDENSRCLELSKKCCFSTV